VITANGQLGLGVNASSGVSVDSNTITSNNREGFWIADWESGGFKATKSSASVTNNTISSNTGVGLWIDVDCNGVTIDGNTVHSNVADGIRIEISYNVVVRNNTVTGNGTTFGSVRGGGTSIFACAGINVNTVSTIAIYNNTVSGNINGIGLQARNRGSGPYGLRILLDATVHDNKITMNAGSAYGQGATGLVQSAGSSAYFTSKGNKFYGNTYVLDSVSARRFAWNDTYLTVAQWKAAGNDTAGAVALG
jgi:parallel beta-helix repeat protein